MNSTDRQQSLYRTEYEHDACGVGMVANLSGEATHDIVEKGMTVLKRLMHRGATGNDPETGDGAGLLLKIPHAFFRRELAKVFNAKTQSRRETQRFSVECRIRVVGRRMSNVKGLNSVE